MKILKTITFYCLLVLCSLALLGSAGKANKNESISDVKAEGDQTRVAPPALLVPIISISGALVVGVLSFCASYRNTSSQVKNVKLELRDSYMKSIFDKRIDAYTKAWEISGVFSSANLLGKPPMPTSGISTVIQNLDSWYNSAGGFLLSPESRNRFFKLRKLCWKSNEIDGLSDSEKHNRYEQIRRSKIDFRMSLRRDVFLLDAPWEKEEHFD